MTTSLVLRPRWTDPVMFLYDNSSALDDAVRNMDAFAGGNFAPSSCRNLIAPSAAYTSSKVTTAGVGEPGKQCSPCTASQGSGGASLPYGYYGSAGYYSCQVSHSHWAGSGVKPSAHSPASAASQHGDKYTDMTTPSAEDYLTSRAKEFTFYPGYSSSPYQPVAGYLDVPVVQAVSGPSEHRNESSLLPVESYQPWAISASGWNAQAYSDKEQPHSRDLWKSSVPGKKKHHASDSSGISYRRGRKKRVPYTKVQLKELEREYAANKFITKDKRRRISALTSLSERQVTIWFQNRRVKEKKVVNKLKTNG
ncbi:homeobox protein Hox-A13a [Ictalurus furcatus]|uniref:homeobox protein Hox-A13a n=1 Tax=Ictalurus furcatus TaxID=66913 RepID=UPI0023504725|nr:homeobox protein Hox-A13a [Ictalurus furcatus]